MYRTGLIAVILAVACASCGAGSSTMQQTGTGGQAPTTEVQDVEDDEAVGVEETTLETVEDEDEDEEMAPPEG
jgi:hypothetical protein